jgi:SAM-dependent methyltransferase
MSVIHEYHARQYETVYRSTERMMEFIERVLGTAPSGTLLDAACGGGANVHHFGGRWPGLRLTGVDHNSDLVAFAGERTRENGRTAGFVEGDLFQMQDRFGDKQFDQVTFLQTLFLFGRREYPLILEQLTRLTKGWLFLSTLIADHNMEVEAKIYDQNRFGADSDEFITYVVADSGRFARICTELGAKEIITEDFEIDIDLTPPPNGGIGTFTRKTANGQRMQFSGAFPMPWKFVAVRMG